jgi:hypothetical protein
MFLSSKLSSLVFLYVHLTFTIPLETNVSDA